MNSSNKEEEEDKYKWIQTIAVFLILFYVVQTFFRWLFTSSSKEKIEGVVGVLFLIVVAVVLYLLSCWITDMPVDLPGLFGFN